MEKVAYSVTGGLSTFLRSHIVSRTAWKGWISQLQNADCNVAQKIVFGTHFYQIYAFTCFPCTCKLMSTTPLWRHLLNPLVEFRSTSVLVNSPYLLTHGSTTSEVNLHGRPTSNNPLCYYMFTLPSSHMVHHVLIRSLEFHMINASDSERNW